MKAISSVFEILEGSATDEVLKKAYCCEGSDNLAQKKRLKEAIRSFMAAFLADESCEIAVFSAPGRTEIGGNHTDHQNGCVLAASVNMDMLAVVSKNPGDKISICSEGFEPIEMSIAQLDMRDCEKESSLALVRGIASRIKDMGYTLGGFNAYVCSNVPIGSGLSSSAAYEVLLASVFNYLFCNFDISATQIAQIGQFAENKYFGKPSGLMDQMASSVGGIVEIDFADPKNPKTAKVDFDFTKTGHALCIINSGADHADLTEEYASITRQMGEVAGFFGKKVLREVDEGEFLKSIPEIRKGLGDRAVLRAMHFFDDNKRAQEQAKALKNGDFDGFLSLVRQSGQSSATKLQNTFALKEPNHQAIPVAIALAERLLEGKGAVRVHGGGFAGTIQAFVPNDILDKFKSQMEEALGANMCHVLSIRPVGACVLIG